MDEGPNNPGASKLDKTIAGILHTLGWIGLYVGVAEPFIQYFIAGAPVSNITACVIATALGLFFHGFAYSWPPERPQVRAFFVKLILPIARHRRMVAIVGVLLLWTITTYQIASIRSDLDTYAMPRQLTSEQSHDLAAYLSNHGPYAVTVRADPLDQEAMQYASAVFNAIHQSNWTSDFDISNNEPRALNAGLCIQEIGTNGKSKDPKKDPAKELGDAFEASNIERNCGGGAAAGEYKLFVMVGHRPIAINRTTSPLFRFGMWLERQGSLLER